MYVSRGILVPFLFSCLLCVYAWAGSLPPSPPETDARPLPGFDPCNEASLREAWRPMDGSEPLSLERVGNLCVMRMPCNFEGTSHVRVSWDLRVPLDLTRCQGVEFDIFCADAAPISHFMAYMRSGGGWYTFFFSPANADGWNRIVLDKSKAGLEGGPAGWGKVDLLRISAWRGKDVDTEFFISGVGYGGGDATIAIVQNDSAPGAKGADSKQFSAYTETVAGYMAELGVPAVVMSDLDLTAAHLEGKRLVILPYAPALPDGAVSVLRDFIKKGGKLASFYLFDKRLSDVAGVVPGPYVGKEAGVSFASIRSSEKPLVGQPPVVAQHSWNVYDSKPLQGRGRVAAYWHDEQGRSTGRAAIVATDSCVHMTHVLLPEDPATKRLLLLSMLGHLMPSAWEQATAHMLKNAGAIGSYASFDAAKKGVLRDAGGRADVGQSLEAVEATIAQARELAKRGEYSRAIAAVADVNKDMLDTYCLAQSPLAGEHRAFWCHDAKGVNGMEWDEAIRILAENGFNVILPNMLWGGSASYKSEVLPVEGTVASKGDQIELCLAACRKYGVECHVWKVNWNTGGRAPKSLLDRIRKEGRTQVGFNGVQQPQWLCPSHPANQQLEIDSMIEVARKYPVDGLHFDYIRYPDKDHCFCGGCRARFEKAIGKKVANWPDDLRGNETLERQWLEFRRSNITKVVAAVSEGARKARPGIRISAAVFRTWPRDRDEIGQDWKVWCDKGYLDFVCPMDYTEHNTQFQSMVEQQLEWAGKVPCYPGIGLSCWPNPTDICTLIDQIKITRRLKTGGFTVFNYGPPQAAEVLPRCGMGITRR